MYKLFFLAIVGCCLVACQPAATHKTIEVTGSFTNTASKKIYLAEMRFNSTQRTIVDTTELDAKGHFELHAETLGEGVYQVFIENGPGIFLINDHDKIELHADAKQLGSYTTPGSPANEGLKKMYAAFITNDSIYQAKKHLLDSTQKLQIKSVIKDSLIQVAQAATDKSLLAAQKSISDFVSGEGNGTAVYYAIGVAKPIYSETGWDSLLQKALLRFPNHPGLQLMRINSSKSSSLDAQGQMLIGQPVPELALPDTSGKLVSIGSFRGKWLLVDVWASWCAPCRAENPNVVAMFKQYAPKNFTVLGVSLDKEKAAWKQAISRDSLKWTHISDLKEWQSTAVTAFGINGIPFNMLVDPKGMVVAVNMQGKALRDALAKHIK